MRENEGLPTGNRVFYSGLYNELFRRAAEGTVISHRIEKGSDLLVIIDYPALARSIAHRGNPMAPHAARAVS